MNKKLLISALVLILLGIGSYVFAELRKPDYGIPTLSARTSETKPSAEFLKAKESVEFYREQIRKNPAKVENYNRLAQIFLQESRVTGNHSEYIPKATIVLDKALKLDPNDTEALCMKASVFATLHDFKNAKKLVEKVIAKYPDFAFARGIQTDALVELGYYDEAVKTADKMVSIRPDIRSYSRVSYLREIYGNPESAADAMKMAAEAAVPGQEERAWALYNLGTIYLNMGKLDTADYLFKGILEERPNYAYALSGRAKVQSAKGNHAGAIQYLVQAVQIMPEHTFLEQMADVYQAMGQKESEKQIAEKVLKAFEQHEEEGWNTDREYAAFCLNHNIELEEALKRAENECKARPDNIDVLQTYAYALFKNGKTAEAVPHIERALRLKTRNPQLLYQAGEIYAAAGQIEKAQFLKQSALQENPYLPALYVNASAEIGAKAVSAR